MKRRIKFKVNISPLLGIALGMALLICFIYFMSVDNWIFTLVLLLLCVGYIFAIFYKKEANFRTYNERVDSCFDLINRFVVGLSVKGSIDVVFTDLKESLPQKLKSEIDHYENATVLEVLLNLSDYFQLDVYHVFGDALKLYSEQGGDVWSIFGAIHERVKFVKSRNDTNLIMARTNFSTLSILWAFAFAILVVCRFVLVDFFVLMRDQLIFPILVMAIYLLCIFSYHLLFSRASAYPRANYEKN